MKPSDQVLLETVYATIFESTTNNKNYTMEDLVELILKKNKEENYDLARAYGNTLGYVQGVVDSWLKNNIVNIQEDINKIYLRLQGPTETQRKP